MGLCFKLTLLVVTGAAVLGGLCLKCCFKEMEVPVIEEIYWGTGKAASDDTSIKPFKIDIPDKVLLDLKDRLAKHRDFTPPLEGVQQQYGMNTNLLKDIVDHWKNKYDWRAREKYLNQYPQFKTKIQGLDIHFIHVKPQVAKGIKVYPMLMVHGWPGSVREFYELIPYLTKPTNGRDYAFELIIPSLPGYGFSQAAPKPGMSPIQISIIFKNLMERLGHKKYYLQGGDWGSLITADLAAVFGDRILGLHNNMCVVNTPLSNIKRMLGAFWPSMVVDAKYESWMYPYSTFFKTMMLEMGYMHIQATKPDTVGVGLNDSPVGLAAYIIEKFTSWTNKNWQSRADGGLKDKFTYDKILDNVMIYWVTGSITTSMRLYSESFNSDYQAKHYDWVPIKVPSACANFKYELAYTPECLLKERYTQLVQNNHFEDGGHFIAFEAPKVLGDDVWSFVDKTLALQNKKTN